MSLCKSGQLDFEEHFGSSALLPSLTASSIMEATKVPLTTGFITFYLVGQAKTGISYLALMRHLEVNYRTAWLVHKKIMQAMSEREEAYVLRGKA